jgi:methyl-accepting chemotaxis protein
MTLSRKVKFFSGVFLLFFLCSFILLVINVQKILVAGKLEAMQKSVNSASMLFKRYDDLVTGGKLSLEDAQKGVIAEIKNISLKKNEAFWIHDISGKIIADPLLPELDGTDMSGYRDSGGKQPFQTMTSLARDKGEGAYEFYFKKPGTDKPVIKYVYIKMFKPWGWVLGAGFYLDDAIVDMSGARNVALIVLAIFSLAVTLGFFILGRSVAQPISSATYGLSLIGQQIASSARQFSDSSHVLAQASSEQAASLEEISSSLEEMSSMTRQNANNAVQADNLMKQAGKVIEDANATITSLTRYMADISQSSRETSKIIKTIDEIAFQTNLLALNAAVEAARAGETGAGFAVVADEVRNLAMRAAEAAKSTAGLLESTVAQINDGENMVQTANQSFGEVASMGLKVAQLVSEIASASQEQAQGIEQVSLAVTQMDTVTQQNAANAEEYASSAQELKSKSDEMKDFIAELRNLIGIQQKNVDHNKSSKHQVTYTERNLKALPRI